MVINYYFMIIFISIFSVAYHKSWGFVHSSRVVDLNGSLIKMDSNESKIINCFQ